MSCSRHTDRLRINTKLLVCARVVTIHCIPNNGHQIINGIYFAKKCSTNNTYVRRLFRQIKIYKTGVS